MENEPKFVSRLEIRKLLHDAHWSKEPSREEVIAEFVDRLVQGDIPDVESFKVTVVEPNPGES